MIRETQDDKIILKNLDPIDIQKFQQNRHPLLFLDWVEVVEPGSMARGHKNFTYNEWFFPAHFEDEPNVPGFVQMEAMAQMFLMTFLTIPGNEGKKAAALQAHACYRKKIIPGDRLEIESTLESYRRGVAKGKSVGYVNGEFACSAEFTVGIPDYMREFIPKASK